jgi:hypothetical protein
MADYGKKMGGKKMKTETRIVNGIVGVCVLIGAASWGGRARADARRAAAYVEPESVATNKAALAVPGVTRVISCDQWSNPKGESMLTSQWHVVTLDHQNEVGGISRTSVWVHVSEHKGKWYGIAWTERIWETLAGTRK